jgi:hypothetical protein
MENSTASIFIKPTVAFNRGDTFVFGSWVCTADRAGSFQRRLTMTPNPRTGFVTLPEVITGDLAGKFGEILLFNQHAEFESGSAYNSNSTSQWVTACELATEPSCVDAPLHEHFPIGLCDASRAHAEALIARRAGKEIVSDYASDSNPGSGYYSDLSHPVLKAKTECIDHVCTRIKLHTRNDIMNTKISATRIKSYYKTKVLKRNINNEFSHQIKCLHRQLTEATHT